MKIALQFFFVSQLLTSNDLLIFKVSALIVEQF